MFPRSGVMWRAGPNRFGPAPGLSNPCATHPGLNRGHWPWQDPTKIPVEEIIAIWREECKGTRYANKLIWGLEGLSQAVQDMEE